MAIKRAKRRSHFTIVNNQIINDSRLTMKARGLLVYMLSKPDDWIFYETEMVKAGPDGRDSIRSAVKEIEKAGYLQREKAKRGEDGKFAGKNWLLHDEPLTENPSTDNPRTDNPTTEKPTTDNPTLVNTDGTKNLPNQELNQPSTDNTNSTPQLSEAQPTDTNFAKEWERSGFGMVNGYILDTLQHWIEDFNGNETLIIKAIHEAAASNPQAPLKYTEGILKRWLNKGIQTTDDVDAEQAKYEQQKQPGKGNGHARQENLPEWAKDGYKPEPDTPLTEEEIKEVEQKRIEIMNKHKERLKKAKEKNDQPEPEEKEVEKEKVEVAHEPDPFLDSIFT